jgi:hypothetical protein
MYCTIQSCRTIQYDVASPPLLYGFNFKISDLTRVTSVITRTVSPIPFMSKAPFDGTIVSCFLE